MNLLALCIRIFAPPVVLLLNPQPHALFSLETKQESTLARSLLVTCIMFCRLDDDFIQDALQEVQHSMSPSIEAASVPAAAATTFFAPADAKPLSDDDLLGGGPPAAAPAPGAYFYAFMPCVFYMFAGFPSSWAQRSLCIVACCVHGRCQVCTTLCIRTC